MRVIVEQTKYCHVDEQIFMDYPILEQYKDKMDYYTGYDNEPHIDYDDNKYYRYNTIVINLNNDELFKLLQELTNESQLVIGYASKYDHEHFNIDFIVEIYDDYRE